MLGLDPISLGFVAVIILVGLIGLANLIPRKEAGGLAVNFGILGTFTGILMALWGFDTADINGSVPQLIGGMKTAFVTSVAGMGVAVVLRAVELITPRKQGAGGVRPEDYLQQMRAQSETLEHIRNGIGEGEGSMVGQIKLLRSDLNDFAKMVSKSNTELREAFDDFAKKVSESSTDAIIDALKEVMNNFNSTINEQFGENFKQLNSAVFQLVDWMDKHQGLVESSHKALTTAMSGQAEAANQLKTIAAEIARISVSMKLSAGHIKNVKSGLEQIPPVLQKTVAGVESLGKASGGLNQVIGTLSQSSAALTASSAALSELAKKAPEASTALSKAAGAVQRTFDGIETRQTALTNKLTEDLEQAGEKNAEAVRKQLQTIGKYQATLTQRLATDLENSSKGNAAALKKQLEGISDHQALLTNKLTTDLRIAHTKNAEAITAQVKVFDDQMGQQLSQALTALGSQLAQLSGKFVQDYTPLTDSLRQVVRLSEQINKNRGNRG